MKPTCIALLCLAGCTAEPLEEPEPQPDLVESVQALGGGVPTECLPVCPIDSCGVQDDGCSGIVWCGNCTCSGGTKSCDREVPVIVERELNLGAGATLDVATSGLSAGADSVLHVLDAASGNELAMNDDVAKGFRGSRLSFTTVSPRRVIVVARAKTQTSGGSCLLLINNGGENITLAAAEATVTNPRAGERVLSVRLPVDAGAQHLMYLMNGQSIVRRNVGTLAGAQLSFPSTTSSARLILGRKNPGPAATPLRLVRDDSPLAGHDPDVDGLGTELETALATCSTLTGFAGSFDCSTAADARDTDGDGLTDGWEVLGRRDVALGLPLVMMGAKPRHKDMFIEIDHARWTVAEAPRFMTVAQVNEIVRHFGDRARSLTAAERAAHAGLIKNPDGAIGVAAHVDVGYDPPTYNEAFRYGAWGGYSSIPPVTNPDGTLRPVSWGEGWNGFVQPARVGVFRYGTGQAGVGGQGPPGGGIGFWFGFENYVMTAAHELGHTMGIAHSGRPGGDGNPDVDPQCKPNYASIMNYAYMPRGTTFSDGTQAASMNNQGLLELNGANPVVQADFLAVLEEVFRYNVDRVNGHIDWNRDGFFAPPGQLVRAYANFEPGGSCEYTRYNHEMFTETTLSTPALTRLTGHTVVLIPGPGALRWKSTASALVCPVPGSTPCGGATWLAGQVPIDSAGGVDAAFVPNTSTVVVVVRTAGGQLAWSRIAIIDHDRPILLPATLLDGPPAGGEPTVATDVDGSALLVWRDPTGTLWQRRFDGAAWGPVAAVLDGAGQPLVTSNSPGLLVAPLSGAPRMLLLASPTSSFVQTLFERDPVTGRYAPSPVPLDTTFTEGRPAMAWVPDANDLTFGGRLTIVYPGLGNGALRQMWSHVRVDPVTGVHRARIGQDSYFDNFWAYGRGADLLFEPGIDLNLRAVFSNTDGWPEGKKNNVQFRPKADGINDFAYRDWTDWRVIRTGLCEHVVNPDNVIFNPVRCAARDW